MSEPIHIVIRYRADPGSEDPALLLARRLFAVLDDRIDSLALIPSAEDDLSVFVNGHRVRPTTPTREGPRVDEILGVIR